MVVPWTDPRCIVCLEERPLTEEHIIPQVIGGKLRASFLCGPCNSRFGTQYDSRLRFDPLVRQTALNLRSTLPDLVESMERGGAYVGRANGQEFSGIIRDGVFQPHACGPAGEFLILPQQHALASIEADLARHGRATEIPDARRRLTEARSNERTTLAPSFDIVNLEFDGFRPQLDAAEQVPEVWPIKTAYEFLACRMGGAVYHPALQPVREILRSGLPNDAAVNVERLQADQADPMHGLFQEANDRHARVQVRLFRRVCYRVHFKQVAVTGNRVMYTQVLSPPSELFAVVEATEQS